MHGVQWKQEPAVIVLASLGVLRTSTLRLDFPFARHDLAACCFAASAVEACLRRDGFQTAAFPF